MSSADERLASGDIDGARALLVDRVRSAPEDQAARLFLFQLMAVSGEWDKAASQLRALAQIAPDAQMLSVVYGQLLEAEKLRAAAFAGGGPVPVLVESSPWVRDWADDLALLLSGDVGAGLARRTELLDAAPDTPGQWNGESFGWIMDADARFGPTFEAIVNGNWGIIPFEAVQEITSEGPRDLRDLVWLPIGMTLRSGQGAAGFLPVRYPGTEIDADAAVKLSRMTNWVGGDGGDTGLGQRLLITDSGAEMDILSLRRLQML